MDSADIIILMNSQFYIHIMYNAVQCSAVFSRINRSKFQDCAKLGVILMYESQSLQNSKQCQPLLQ